MQAHTERVWRILNATAKSTVGLTKRIARFPPRFTFRFTSKSFISPRKRAPRISLCGRAIRCTSDPRPRISRLTRAYDRNFYSAIRVEHTEKGAERNEEEEEEKQNYGAYWQAKLPGEFSCVSRPLKERSFHGWICNSFHSIRKRYPSARVRARARRREIDEQLRRSGKNRSPPRRLIWRGGLLSIMVICRIMRIRIKRGRAHNSRVTTLSRCDDLLITDGTRSGAKDVIIPLVLGSLSVDNAQLIWSYPRQTHS